MSIGSFLAAAAATAPTTQAAPGVSELLLAAVFAIAALAVAYAVGAHDPDSVRGPLRMEATDSPTQLLVIVILGFALWFGISGTYLALFHGADIAEARQRKVQFILPLRTSATLNAAVQLVAAIAVLIAAQILIRDGSRKLGFRVRDVPSGILYGVIGALVAIPLTLATSIFITWLWATLRLKQPEDHQLLRLMFEEPDRVARALVVISAVIIAPLFEEVIFRGHIQTLVVHTIRRMRGVAQPFEPITNVDARWIRWTGICAGAFLFAIIHEAGWMMPPLFVLAVCFGYVYERTGKLWAPIVMHALFNATSIAIALLTR